MDKYIVNGGEIKFEMSNKPNLKRGVEVTDAPSSMTKVCHN